MRTNVTLCLVLGLLVTAVTIAACRSTPAPPPPPEPGPVQGDPAGRAAIVDRELMITDLSVVNDARTRGPDGPWSFGFLMRGLAGTDDPVRLSAFTVNWLKRWEAEQTVNTFKVPPRGAIRSLVIEPWKTQDGQAGVPD